MRLSLYEADHEHFRDSVRAFLEKNVAPFHDEWERDGIVPRELWTAAGAQGLVVEVHPRPDQALSDGSQSLDFDSFERLMLDLGRLMEATAPAPSPA